MNEQLYWPPEGSGKGCLGWFLIFPCGVCIITIPIGIWLINEGKKEENQQIQIRQKTMELTHSVLMSKAKYVGGHPLIPESSEVVVCLSETHFSIYSIDDQYRMSPLSSIALLEIARVATGRPKTAKEIYDEDHGYTIDVVEQSPFLSVIFKIKDHSYVASFERFEKDSPQEWCNKTIALQYQLRNEQSSTD